MERISGIYKITNTLDNKFYIGSSVNIYQRWHEHRSDLSRNKHHSIKLQRSWNKYGEQNFKFEVVETCDPVRDTLIMIEQKYLDLKPYFNCYYIAYSCLGYKHSEKTRAIKKIQNSGKNNPNYGKSPSKEAREKIAEANRNRVIKDSTRLKQSINSKNSNWNKIQRKSILMFDINTNELIKEFNSVTSASIFTGYINHRVGIKRAAKGEQKQAYGYKWRFKNDL